MNYAWFIILQKINISNDNSFIKFNNRVIKIKFVDYVLYIDDEKIGSIDCDITAAYVTDNYILLEAEGQTHFHPYAINKDNKLITVSGNPDTPFCTINIDSVEKDKVFGIKACYDDFNDGEEYEIKVEFVYEENQIKIKEIITE